MRHWEHQGTDSGRDEQRRQQNEYHAALAEQVRLQEAKKLADRRDRMASQQPLPHQRGSGGNGPPVQGGLFAGLGQNHTVGKSTYARGHHLEKMTADLKKAGQPPPDQMNVPGPEPPYAAYNKGPPPAQYNAPQPYAQQHQYAPPPQEQQQYHPPPQQGGYPEQQYQQMPHPEMNAPLHQPFPQQGYHQIGYDNHPHQQPFLPLPPPPYGATNHPSPPPPSQLQHQQPPSSSHGRRHQVSAIVAPDPTRRTAQLETQSFLKQQMEDNQRRKAEAKRKKDEEERAEMQRIEKELKVQAEAFEAEKRSKVKDAVLKQQQLEADLRLKQEEELKKTNPKLRHKQLTQDDLAVPSQPQPHGFAPDGHPFGTPRDLPGFGPSSQFTPQDNPPWQTQPQNHTFQMQALPQNHQGEQQGFFGGAPPSYPPNSGAFPSDAYSSAMYPLPMQQIPSSMMMPPMQMQSSPSMNQFMDARLQMLTNELASQRAMVEQLVHQTPTPRGPALTVDDFERLRRDMQAELDRRDAMHQQELAAWKSRAGGGGIVQTQSTRHLPGVDNNDLNNHTNKRVHGGGFSVHTSDGLPHHASHVSSPPKPPFAGAKGQYTACPPTRTSLESNQADEAPTTFVSTSPHKPFPGANGQYNVHSNASKGMANSPQKPFPGSNGQYNLQAKQSQQPLRPVPAATIGSTESALDEAPSTFVSTSPHKPFPGASGQYNLQTATFKPAQQPMKSPPKPLPGTNGQYQVHPKQAQPLRQIPTTKESTESNQLEDTNTTFVSNSPYKPFPGANGQYKIQADVATLRPRDNEKVEIANSTGLHNLTHQRSPRRLQHQKSQSPPKTTRSSRLISHEHDDGTIKAHTSRMVESEKSQSKIKAQSSRLDVYATRVSPQKQPPTNRPKYKSAAHDDPVEFELTSSTKSTPHHDAPFAVVNLLEGSLDGPSSSFVVSSNNNNSATLKCDSQMIYFNGHVDNPPALSSAIISNQPDPQLHDMSALSPRFTALFASKCLSPHKEPSPEISSYKLGAPSSVVLATTSPLSPTASIVKPTEVAHILPGPPCFRVHDVAPSSWQQSFRYVSNDERYLGGGLDDEGGNDGSFDIDDLYEKNTTRRTLLEQLENRSTSAHPHHVEELVATFRAITSQRSTRPSANTQDEVRGTSKWVSDSMPAWLQNQRN